MNHIRTKRRSRITPEHLNDIMRIRLNSVDELEKFPTVRNARDFMKDKHIRTDDSRGKKTSSSLLDDDPNEEGKKSLPKISFL